MERKVNHHPATPPLNRPTAHLTRAGDLARPAMPPNAQQEPKSARARGAKTRPRAVRAAYLQTPSRGITAKLRTSTKFLDFSGFDSSVILLLRGGILMSIGNSPEMLSQQILVGIILVGRSGVRRALQPARRASGPRKPERMPRTTASV